MERQPTLAVALLEVGGLALARRFSFFDLLLLLRMPLRPFSTFTFGGADEGANHDECNNDKRNSEKTFPYRHIDALT